MSDDTNNLESKLEEPMYNGREYAAAKRNLSDAKKLGTIGLAANGVTFGAGIALGYIAAKGNATEKSMLLLIPTSASITSIMAYAYAAVGLRMLPKKWKNRIGLFIDRLADKADHNKYDTLGDLTAGILGTAAGAASSAASYYAGYGIGYAIGKA